MGTQTSGMSHQGMWLSFSMNGLSKMRTERGQRRATGVARFGQRRVRLARLGGRDPVVNPGPVGIPEGVRSEPADGREISVEPERIRCCLRHGYFALSPARRPAATASDASPSPEDLSPRRRASSRSAAPGHPVFEGNPRPGDTSEQIGETGLQTCWP